MKNILKKFPDQDRREFLAYSAKTFLGVGLMPLAVRSSAFASATPARMPTAKNVIYLYMAGGMSHLDTLDPKSDRSVKGPVEAIGTKEAGIQISEYLPRIASQMDKLALLRSLSSTQGAHEEADTSCIQVTQSEGQLYIREWVLGW